MKYLRHTLITSAAGLVFFIIGELIYGSIIKDGIAPLTLPLYFLLFMLILSIVLWALSLKRGTYFYARDKRKKTGNIVRKIIIFFVVMILLSGLLEFLYEIGGDLSPQSAVSYIFIIDDSGSMQQNDPNNERKRAISSIMQEFKADTPYSVYVFADFCSLAKPMSTDTSNDFALNSEGGTNIVRALKTIYKEYKGQGKTNLKITKVLLLTDGASSSWGLSRILKKYQKANIAISTVGFGSADSAYLTKVANSTGGVYVSADKISQLKQSMEQALLSYSIGKRNLLSDRFCDHDALYAFLRITFLILLSLVFSLIKSSAMFDVDRQPIYFAISFGLGIIASILMEVMISVIGTPMGLAHCVCCLLWAAVPADISSKETKRIKKYDPIDFDDFGFSDDFNESYNSLGANNDEEENGLNSLDF